MANAGINSKVAIVCRVYCKIFIVLPLCLIELLAYLGNDPHEVDPDSH